MTVAEKTPAPVICDGGDPPECCGAPHCRACGSSWTMPTLVEPGQWKCWSCEETWLEER